MVWYGVNDTVLAGLAFCSVGMFTLVIVRTVSRGQYADLWLST